MFRPSESEDMSVLKGQKLSPDCAALVCEHFTNLYDLQNARLVCRRMAKWLLARLRQQQRKYWHMIRFYNDGELWVRYNMTWENAWVDRHGRIQPATRRQEESFVELYNFRHYRGPPFCGQLLSNAARFLRFDGPYDIVKVNRIGNLCLYLEVQ
jgi:hypothetical protein